MITWMETVYFMSARCHIFSSFVCGKIVSSLVQFPIVSHWFQRFECFTVLLDGNVGDNHSCSSCYRLEDQTKKLHKDMKKSTEADLGMLPPGVPLISTCSPTYLMLLGRYFGARQTFACLGLCIGVSALQRTKKTRLESAGICLVFIGF